MNSKFHRAIQKFLFDKNLEIQDVYSLYKPLYVITKILGLASFPLQKTSKNKYKKCYYIIQVIFVGVMVYLAIASYTDQIVLESFGNSSIIMYINRVLSILLLIVAIITFLTSHVHARHIPKILQTIKAIDSVISRRKYQSTQFKLFNSVLLLSYMFFVQLLIGEVLLDYILKSRISVDKVFRGICRTLSEATILQYATVLNLLYWRMVIVNDWINKINLNDEDEAIADLKTCASLLQEIYDICKKINRIFGMFLASVLFVIFTEYLETMFAFLATYWMLGIKIVDRPSIEELTLWEITINNFLATLLHCYVAFFFADLIHKEMNRTNEVLDKVHLRSFSFSKLLRTIYHMYHQINHNQFKFTTAKFTELGWHQAFVMFGGVISYSTVSSQLYLNVKQKEFDLLKNSTVTNN